MRKTIEQIICDLCNEPTLGIKEYTMPTIFHTDQTEGRGCNPYISMQKMDLCPECAMKAINIHGWGAQGYNEYKLFGNSQGDKIRSMSDEELANFIPCPYMKADYDECRFGWHEPDMTCEQCKLEWIKSYRMEER